MCGAESNEDLYEKQPPISDEDLLDYTNDPQNSALSCSDNNYRVDFLRSWRKNPLNEQARQVFIQNFFAAYNGGSYRQTIVPKELLTEDIIGSILDRHVVYRRQCWLAEHVPLSTAEKYKSQQRNSKSARQATVCTQH